MSIRYRAADGTETIVSGLTPGGDIEAGAVTERSGTVTVPSVSKSSSANVNVVFSEPMPDADYQITLDSISNPSAMGWMTFHITSKSATGFTITAFNVDANSQHSGGTLAYKAVKTYSVQHAAQNAEDIANILSVIPSNATSANKLVSTSQLSTALSPINESIENISDVIPSDASVDNKLVTKNTICANNAGAHNSIYRGKYLGSSVTAEQYAQIGAGTFEDLFIGDYWTIEGVNYRIAAFDYWLRSGDTQCTIHHVVLIPDTNLYNVAMNSSNITTGGYVGSAMRISNLADANIIINGAFGSAHILNHRELFTNSVASDGKANNWTWTDSMIDLMNECMVYGCNIWGSHPGYESGIDTSQLPLFAMSHNHIINRSMAWWLRSIVSESRFALVGHNGSANFNGASTSLGVRPAFGICESN